MGSSGWLGRRVAALEDVAEGDQRELYPGRDERSKLWKELLGPFVDGLEPKYRDLIEATFFERRTHEELAEKAGVSHQAMTQRVETAMGQLVRAIALEDEEFAAFEASKTRGRGRPARDRVMEEHCAWRVLQARLGEALGR